MTAPGVYREYAIEESLMPDFTHSKIQLGGPLGRDKQAMLARMMRLVENDHGEPTYYRLVVRDVEIYPWEVVT